MIRAQITNTLSIGDRQPLTLIGGPCVVESEDFTQKMVKASNCRYLLKYEFFQASLW
jgi:3-deoxy-D-manno-octulosonic acid (KDO) 8-phosphate synthase